MVSVQYGPEILELNVPKENLAFNLHPNDFPRPGDEADEIRQSILNPVGCKRLRDSVPKDASVVILGDDRTRFTPQDRIIPIVLEELNAAGVPDNQIKIIIAYGTHRAMTDDEIEEKFGRELMSRIEIKGHECLDHDRLIDKGVTRRGTRIFVNKEYMEADIRIGIGSVCPHHPTGWSGGAKILLPGVAGAETTCDMHLLGATEQQLGKIITPCREEMEDFAKEAGLDFIVNTILDNEGYVLKSVAGHFVKAHREAVKWGMSIYGVNFQEPADITLSSTYPLDFDLTQCDKGLFSAEIATQPGGEIILVTPCPEGIAPTHGEEMAQLACYNDEELWTLLEQDKVHDRFCASECMYLNHIKKKFKTSLMMDPVSCNIMGFHYLGKDDLAGYIERRIELDSTLKIGIINESSEVLPVLL